MNAKTLEYFPVTNTWTKGFINLSSGSSNTVHKIIEIFDLTICLDQMDSSGQIEIYQEPILYRCSVQCRFITNYQSANSQSSNFIKFNIQFGPIDLNISTCQMPQIRRLIELMYALYYGVVNWDAIVGCGFTNQIMVSSNPNVRFESELKTDTVIETSNVNVENTEKDTEKSWASWAWSYVPSIFSEEDNLIDEDHVANKSHLKKIMIFSIFFQSIHFKIKKSHITKSLFGSRRSNCNKTLNHFFSIIGNDIGINTINNGLGFFNVQLGCSEIKLCDSGHLCVCGQEMTSNHEYCMKPNCNEFIIIGDQNKTNDQLSQFYLTENLFNENQSVETNILENDIMRLNSVTSLESYAAIYSQEKCLETFHALWFDYIYYMQIVKNNLDESEIDMLNLCNTDGIRETSQCNLYIGKSDVEINSYLVHNMKEIVKSLDTSKYTSYFQCAVNDNMPNIIYPLEEQVARIHEFVPIREHNISLVNLSIKIHAFTESHQVADEFPILTLKSNSLKFSKVVPMYPKSLIGCVSILNTNLLKESPELINKCYMTRLFEITGFSMSFMLPVIEYEDQCSNNYIETKMLEPCDIKLSTKWLMHSDSWKTSLVLNLKKLEVSKIQLTLIPSHLKASFVIIATNYPWLNYYFGTLHPNSGLSSMYKRLDDLTSRLLGSQSSLIEACHKCYYKNKTHELHIYLPDFFIQLRETSLISYIDAKMIHDPLLLFLKDPDTLSIIPVLDNKDDSESLSKDGSSALYILSCQIPNQIKPVNCAFSLKCQTGSVNVMFSQPLVSWFFYPLLDLDLEKYIESDIFPMYYGYPRSNTTSHTPLSIPDIRSVADGSSRPESPIIFYNNQPVPGIPRPINLNIEKSKMKNKSHMKFLSNKSGWWNVVKNSCSKYFFLLQSLDVCIRMSKSKLYITTIIDSYSFQSQLRNCNEWVESYLQKTRNDDSIFVVKITRLALINSQRRDCLNECFLPAGNLESLNYHTKSTAIIDSLPWELIFHDIRIDCFHSTIQSKIVHDSILKPVSINCTLSATPKCSSPDKLDTLYSVSWGVHIDITEVQPTIKQIYLAKILKLFGSIVLGLPWTDFIKNLQCLITGHYKIIKGNATKKKTFDEKPFLRSRQSASTKSTKKSKSSKGTSDESLSSTKKNLILNTKLEAQSINEVETEFKMSFWIQCTLSQFQLIIMNDLVERDDNAPYVYLMVQIDDASSCVDVQEKFVEFKGKLGSILCQIGLMKQEKIISEIPILKSGSKFIKNCELSFSVNPSNEFQDSADEMVSENIIRHCFSIAVIRTTPNNLSKRPMSSYHQFKDTDSFRSYPTEFTGNFSTAIELDNKYQSYVTQISCIIDPFDLYLPPFFLKQCLCLSNISIALYNQLLETSLQKWSLADKIKSPISASSIKNEPYFISEDIPQFHLLVKSSRITMPRYQNEKSSICDYPTNENGCLIMIWKKISVQPFSNNAICRPSIIENSTEDSFSTYNCLDDNRQFQLDIFECGIYLNKSSNSVTAFVPKLLNFDGIPREPNEPIDGFSTSVVHGQNPAFEWNNFSKLSSFMQKNSKIELLPIMKPIDIQVIFAGAIHEPLTMSLQRHLVGGYGLEINILTNLELLLDYCALDVMKSITKNINEIFSDNNNNNNMTNEAQNSDDMNCMYSKISSMEDFCLMKNIDIFIPSVPINVLMTCRRIQMLVILPKNNEINSLSSDNGFFVSISQPHAVLSFKNRQTHKLELAFFDLNLGIAPNHWSQKINFYDPNQTNFWQNLESFILAEMKSLMKTKPGCPDQKTGVPASLLTVIFSNFYRSSASQCMISINRQVLIDIDSEDLIQISDLLALPTTSQQSNSINVSKDFKSPSFPWLSFVPNNICLHSELFSINISDYRNYANKFELKFGPINISSNSIRNYRWNNLYWTCFYQCDSFVIIHSSATKDSANNDDGWKFILHPVKIAGKATLNCYRFNSLDDFWKSFEVLLEIDVGVITVSIGDEQLTFCCQLMTKILKVLSPTRSESVSCPNSKSNNSIDNRVEIFNDELRTNKFELITESCLKENEFVSGNGTGYIADESTISFSGDNDDVASMLWTYPEPRCIISLEVKPVPFVFIECNLAHNDNYEQLQIPCKLEYWNSSTNQYELYRTFYLSENQTEKIYDLPSIEELSQLNQKIVVAKSWRVVFDCYARCVHSDSQRKSESEKAMLIYLSPMVLAASMSVDSCYGSFLIKSSLFKISIPQINVTFYEKDSQPEMYVDSYKPYQLIQEHYEDYSISDHNILFKLVIQDLLFKNSMDLIKEIMLSKIEFFISDPYMALQIPLTILENVRLALYQSESSENQFLIDVDSCQLGFDTISLKQTHIMMEKIIRLIPDLVGITTASRSIASANPKILFCNNLNRKIKIMQKEYNYLKMSNTSRIGGLSPGEGIIMKFLPVRLSKMKEYNEEHRISIDKIELILGLYSELKGTIKWTEPVDFPLTNMDSLFVSGYNFGIWKLDTNLKCDPAIFTNSSAINNSFNARNLFFIQNFSSEGLTKIIVIGNTVINNATDHLIHVNFSLPTEISSGVSFNIPPQSDAMPLSHCINWKFISLSNLKNIFDLSFRVVNSVSTNSEYRSLVYQIEVPKLSDKAHTSYQKQLIIKLQLYKADGQIISSRNFHCQFLCTLEWFKFQEADDMLLLITLSPLLIFENQMLRDVKLEINKSLLNENSNGSNSEEIQIIKGKGGNLKLMNLFPTDSVKLNATFVNDEIMLFDEPLELTEQGVFESLCKRMSCMYDQTFSTLEEKEKLEFIGSLLVQIIENNISLFKNPKLRNPYSMIVTISPWILLSNKTQLNLVLSFGQDFYYLESNNDFVPPKSNNPMKLGITFENDVFWSKPFLVGKHVHNMEDSCYDNAIWNFNKSNTKDEAILQVNIVVGKKHSLVPITLRYLFTNSISNMDEIHPNKFHHLIIEPTIFISNQTDLELAVQRLWASKILETNKDIRLPDEMMLPKKCGYYPLNQFQSSDLSEQPTHNKLSLKLNLPGNYNCATSLVNCLTIVDLDNFSFKTDSEIDIKTNFLYVKNQKDSSQVDFEAFTVNSTFNMASQKLYIDIFECKFIPIKILNRTAKTIWIGEMIDDKRLDEFSTIQVEPLHSAPYWPIDFQIDINKDGYSTISKCGNRFRFGVETDDDIDWTEYVPLTCLGLSSSFDITTNLGKNQMKLVLESSTFAKLIISIYDPTQSIDMLVTETSCSQIKKLSINRFSFSLLERQVDLETLIESVRISVENLICTFSSHSTTNQAWYEISANHIQIDNKLFSSGLYDFPVLLNSLQTKSKQFISARLDTNGVTHSLKVTFHDEVEVFIENVFLFDLLRIFSQFSNCLVSKPKDTTGLSILSIQPLNITKLKISPIFLRITVHAFLKIYVSCESTSLRLPDFTLNDSCVRLSALQKLLWYHYVTAVLVRCGYVLGSIELLGNPSGIVRHLSTGLTDLLSSRNIDHGLLVDFLLRLLSFCRHTSGGLISSFTGIASSVSRNLDYITLDDTHITRQDFLRRKFQSNGVMYGFISGLSGFALSLLGAVAGLADQPIQASQKALCTNSSVSMAVIKGLGKGLIGAVTKPLSGTAELFAQTGRGLLNTTGIAINRHHSNLVPFKLTSESEILINPSRFLSYSLIYDIDVGEPNPSLFWSSVAVNCNNVPVYLFLSDAYLVEWFIDNPPKNEKTIYPLSNYNISVCLHSTLKNCLKLQFADRARHLSFNGDHSINTFISELQYAKENDGRQSISCTSSVDSTEFVKFTSVPTLSEHGAGNAANDSPALVHSEEITFHSNESLDGILDALVFLNYIHGQRSLKEFVL